MPTSFAKSGVLAIAIAAAVVGGPARGQQLDNTFVSGKGADTGNCPSAAPCRSLQYALSQTVTGGQITILDSAGYGFADIERGVSISAAPGIVAISTGIFVGNAVGFNLEGLTVEGGLYVDSVPYNTPSSGSITRCTIRNGGAQLQNGGGYQITDSTIFGDVSIAAIRYMNVHVTILRTAIFGATFVENGADSINFGQIAITDSLLGNLSIRGGASASSTTRMVRSSTPQFLLQASNIAYLTDSSIDQLSIEDDAVVKSSGNNDIISVSGNLQPLLQK